MSGPSPLTPVEQRYDRLNGYSRTPDGTTFILTHPYGEAHLGFAGDEDTVEITPTLPALTVPQWQEFSEWMIPTVAIAEQDTAHYYRQQHINWEQYGLVRIISDSGETNGLPIWVAAGQETFPYGTPYLIWQDDRKWRNDTADYTWVGLINGIATEKLAFGTATWNDTAAAANLAKKILTTPEDLLIIAALLDSETVAAATARHRLQLDMETLFRDTPPEHHCDEDDLAEHILQYYATTEQQMPSGYLIDILTPDKLPQRTFPATPFLILQTNTGSSIDWLTSILPATPYHHIPWDFTDPNLSHTPILISRNPDLLNLITPTLHTWLQEQLNAQFRKHHSTQPDLRLPVVQKVATITSPNRNSGGSLQSYGTPITFADTRVVKRYYTG